VSLSNHQTGEDSGLLRASETGMTFLSRSVLPVLDERSDGQIPESLHFRAVSHQVPILKTVTNAAAGLQRALPTPIGFC